MAIIEKVKTNTRYILRILAVSLAVVVLLCAFTQAKGENGGTEDAQTLYRESAVERGDLTVGVTETAVATLKTYSLSFEAGAEIEELFIKAGQAVKEGDLIATITTESIDEQIKSLKADYQEAALKLSEAQLAQQKGELDAKSSYNNTVNKAGTAGSTYEITLEKLEQAVSKAEKQIEEIQTEIRTYTTLLRHISDYEEDYDLYISSKGWYEDSQAWVKSCEELISKYKKEKGAEFSETDAEYQRLLSNLEAAKADLSYAKLEYEDAAKDYDKKYDTNLTDEDDIKEARSEAQARLVDAQAALKEAKYNLEMQSSQAVLTKDESISRAELAETTYQMELQSLSNNVTSKQLALQNIQEQVDKYTALLEKTSIYAPCSGVVVSVSHSAGDTVQAGETVATVSDNQNVFVYLSVTQDDITGISLGQSCSVEMDAFETVAFAGIVDGITTTPARSAAGGASYNVTVKLEGDTAQIYEGMTGTATLITRQQKDVLYVSSRTVYTKDGGSYVKVMGEDGATEEVAVTTGFSDGRNVEIISGLSEGQTVVIESQVTVQR